MRFRNIVFDLDNTLLDFNKTEEKALEDLFLFYEIEGDFRILHDKFSVINSSLWQEHELGKLAVDDLKVLRHKYFMKNIGKSDVNPYDCAILYEGFLSEKAYPITGSYQILDYLSEKGYNLILASNGLANVQYPRLAKSKMEGYFSSICISQELGYNKPDIEFFEKMFEKSQCRDKNSVLMIGDNLNSDILGGINAGISTCWFNPNTQVSHIKPTYEITNLLELKVIL